MSIQPGYTSLTPAVPASTTGASELADTPADSGGLPPDDIDWPPPECVAANRLYARWAAWHAGDPAMLSAVYANTVGYSVDPQFSTRSPQYTSGTVQQAPRTFWGAPPTPGALRSAKLHVPLAGDIAAVSADLLFGEPPALVVPDKPGGSGASPSQDPTQQWLDRMMSEGGLQVALLEGAEIASAYGGVYLRVGWDEAVADHVLFDVIPPDAAVPQWRSGHLSAVTFWRELARTDDGKIYRHLERHEPGRIYHGLYVSGDSAKLGRRKPLQAHPETAEFATLVGGEGWVDTGAQGLCVEYIPNMRPNRRDRGSPLGRSDFDGIEGVLDALDEAWTSWMRDIRIGKGRILVPDVYFENQGPGRGANWDAEKEVYTQINALPGADGLAMQVVQFAIRVEEHERTCQALTAQALRGAGYSVQTFGESGEVAATATEVVARERRSFTTRGRKANYCRPCLGRIANTALQVQIAKFGTDGLRALVPDIEWPDGVAVDPLAQAQALQMLSGAGAISTRTKVEILHPDWDDERIDAEVAAIQKAAQPPPGLAPTSDAQPPGEPPTGGPAGTSPPDGPPVQAPRQVANGRAPAQVGSR